METKDNNFSKNLKALRKIYGETQDDLGMVLVISDRTISNKAISDWERGVSMPSYNRLIDIANHYNITVDDLLHGEFNDLLYKESSSSDFNKMCSSIFPAPIKLDNKNDLFIKTLNEINKLEEFINLDGKFLITMIERIVNTFEKYYKDTKDYDALICEVIAILGLGSLMLTKKIDYNAFDKVISKEQFQMAALFPIVKKENNAINIAINGLSERFEGYLLSALTRLQKNPETVDIANYYNGLRYIINLVDNGISSDYNFIIGYSLLNDEYFKDNIYAETFLDNYDNFMQF